MQVDGFATAGICSALNSRGSVIEPRTVLFIHSGRDWIRGSERVLLDLAAGLSPERFRPVVWCDAPALRRACADAGVEVVEREFPRILDAPWWGPDRGSVAAAVGVMQATGAGVVHVNGIEPFSFALRAARRAQVPVLIHLHIPTTADERVFSGLHQATVVVGVSRSVLDWTQSDGLPAGAARLIYNGVVPDRLERGDASGLRDQLGVPSGATVAATVGSLILLKDIATVIQAVRLVAGSSQAALHLLVVGEGEGEERSRLEAMARDAGLSSQVHFLGDRQDVGAILRDAADVAISASRSEALPLNLLEAGYFGLPMVVTDIPPHREILTHELTGLLFEPGNPEELARSLLRLERDPELGRRLGENARVRVREVFLADRFVEEFEQLYAEVTSGPRWRHGWLGGLRVPSSYRRFLRSRLFGLPYHGPSVVDRPGPAAAP